MPDVLPYPLVPAYLPRQIQWSIPHFWGVDLATTGRDSTGFFVGSSIVDVTLHGGTVTTKAKPDPGTYLKHAMTGVARMGTAPLPSSSLYQAARALASSTRTPVLASKQKTLEGTLVGPVKEARFTSGGGPVIRQPVRESRPRANPASALNRLKSCESFYLKVQHSQVQAGPDENTHYFTIDGECDKCVDVADLTTLLESRFSDGATVKLTETGTRMVKEIAGEIERRECEATAVMARADRYMRDTDARTTELDEREQTLDDDPRIRDAKLVLDGVNKSIERARKVMERDRVDHLKALMKQDILPGNFNPDRFPEAELLAEATIERWWETVEDQTHMVSGDFIELQRILNQMMQRLAMRVADRVKDGR